MALGTGSIAFVGYNADGADNLVFVVLTDIVAGTVISFTDNEWNGLKFNTGEATWTWTASGDVAAGTVVTMDGLAAGNTATSNLGTIEFANGSVRDLTVATEAVYAYVGSATAPTFLSAIANNGFTSAATSGLLTNTGLVLGDTAVTLQSLIATVDTAAYVGTRLSSLSFADLRAMINNPVNWIGQGTASDDSSDGVSADVPFATDPFLVDPLAQTIAFSSNSVSVGQVEGNAGVSALSFTVVRSGASAEGVVSFSGTITLGQTNAADFGGSPPVSFSGTIEEGQTGAVVTIYVSSDALYEDDESFQLLLRSVSNSNANITTTIGAGFTATGTIVNDDLPPSVIASGETISRNIELSGLSTLHVQQGGYLKAALTVTTDQSVQSVVNEGTIQNKVAGPSLAVRVNAVDQVVTVSNLAPGEVVGFSSSDVVSISGSVAGSAVFNNSGTLRGSGDVVEASDLYHGFFTLNNLAGGVIDSGANSAVVGNANINNYGTITAGNDAVDYKYNNVTINNYAGGSISGGDHAITGKGGMVLLNALGASIIGRDGSALNVDNSAYESATVYVTNYGLMEGRSKGTTDSDGDAIDVDGFLNFNNYGIVKGLGASGYHDGEPNVSEAIAIGGGTIVNHAGGEIYGYGRAIQVDNSNNAGAFSSTVITNDGLIQGDGHGPEGVAPEHAAPFVERIRGGEAINILGTFADTLTNSGTIIGGVKMDGGDDTLFNSGTMTATGGSAIDMGAGDDSVVNFAGGVITGDVLLGAGDDRFFGNESAEKVDGGQGDDLLSGGGGADMLTGGEGSDVYSYTLGEGSDTIVEGVGLVGDADLLLFDEVDAAGVVMHKHGNDVEIVLANGDVITLKDQLAGGGVENIMFSDGEILGREDIVTDLVNRGPVANDDVLAAVDEDAPSFLISFASLLGNDTDADLDGLSITGIVSPVGGTFTVETDGIRFTPTANYNGPASFAYTVSDNRGGTSQATASFTVTAVNDGPMVTPPVAVVTDEDTAVIGQIVASDIEGDTLTYVVKPDAGAAHGTVTIDANGNWVYTPDANYHGTDSFTVLVSDGQATVETIVEVGVTSVNDAPMAVSDIGSAGENEANLFDLVANDTDADGDALSLSGVSVTGVSGVALNNTQAQDAFSVQNGQLAFNPGTLFDGLNDGQTATVTLSYTVQDAAGANSTAEFVLSVNGSTEPNIIIGNNSANALFGTEVVDIIAANDGNDTVFGRGGNDIIDAGNGTDTVFGGAGNDIIDGGAGKDTLMGDAGNDVLAGGQGNDLLYGGDGNDTFVFHAGEGRDTVFDFTAGAGAGDVIELDHSLFADFAALMAAGAVTDTSIGVQIAYGDGSAITLSNVHKADLAIDDFRFA